MWYHSLNKVAKIFICIFLYSHSSAGKKVPEVWQIPSENTHFVGRKLYLKKIKDIFQKQSLKIAVLVAGPGFGKSQITKQYAHQNYSKYQVAWWFRANQYMEPQFRDFAEILMEAYQPHFASKAQTMGLKRLKMLVSNIIRKNSLKCLIIFDNVRKSQDIMDYIPQSHDKNSHVIITTRNGNFLTNNILVPVFTEDEALHYTRMFLTQEPHEEQKKIGRYVYYHPATLKLSIDYISHYPGMTIATYIEDHHQKQEQLSQYPVIAVNHGEKLEDTYNNSLPVAILLHLEKLKAESKTAYTLLSLLTFLHRDHIQLDLIRKWLKQRYPKANFLTLLGYIRKNGFLDGQGTNKKIGAYISMHELIQKITGNLIPIEEKKVLIDEICGLLENPFEDRSDIVIEKIARNNIPLLNAEKLLDEAHRLNYRTIPLTRLRVRFFDVATCGLRDFEKAKDILDHLQDDLAQGIELPEKDYILYLITLSFFSSIYNPNYTTAVQYGEKALRILTFQGSMYEERIRLIANLMQFYSFQGDLATCKTLYEKGKIVLGQSNSTAYNALFLYATSLYLLSLGKPTEVIDMIKSQKDLMMQLDDYPTMRFYILSELAQAYINNKSFDSAQKILLQAEADATEFYDNQKNTFFARLRLLQNACCYTGFPLQQSVEIIHNSLRVYDEAYSGVDKHINQAEAYLQLGKIYDHYEDYDHAKLAYLKSNQIFTTLLRNQSVDKLSDLYTSLALLGVKKQEEPLTHTYLKKHIDIFGLDNQRTQEIILFLDKKGLSLPF